VRRIRLLRADHRPRRESPERRPSVSAATSHRRSARQGETAMLPRAQTLGPDAAAPDSTRGGCVPLASVSLHAVQAQ